MRQAFRNAARASAQVRYNGGQCPRAGRGGNQGETSVDSGNGRARAGVAAIVAAAVALTGCSTIGKTAEERQPEQSAWEKVLDGIGPDGQISKDTALKAFSLAVAPLPGVKTPSGGEITIRSGSAAVRWTLGHWSELTPEQQAVVKRAIAPGPGAVVARAAKPGTGGGGADLPEKDVKVLAPLVADGVATLEQRLGRSLRSRVTVEVETSPDSDEPRALAMASPRDADGGYDGVPVTCDVLMYPRAFTMTRAAVLETVYHEVFHCFQAELFPDLATFFDKGMPMNWLIEGQAEWAGNAVAGSAEGGTHHWKTYLTEPGKSLYRRAYDATGFYAHLAESGIDPWKVMDGMITAALSGGNEAAFNAATGANAAAFLDTWPSGYARGRRPGKAWDTTGPGITNDQMTVHTAAVPSGGNVPVKAPVATNRLIKLDLKADVTTFTVSPGAHGRLGPSSGDDLLLTALAGQNWCTRGECACPEGTAGAGIDLPRLVPGLAWLAVTGGTKAASVTATGMSMAEFCRKDPPKEACLIGDWTTTQMKLAGQFAQVAGGSGVTMKITPRYVATINFDGMAPIQGTMSVAGNPGMTFRYHGTVSGKMAAAPGPPSPATGAGSITATAAITLGGTTVPVFNRTPMSQLTGGAAGAIDKEPILGSTDYTCSGDSLTLTRVIPNVGTTTWVFARR